MDYVFDKTVEKKFNSVVVMSALSETANAQYGPVQAYGTFPFTDTKLTPSEAHWSHVDYVLTSARRRGLVVQLAYLYVGHPSANDGFASRIANCSEAECTAFGVWLGNRYKNVPNLIWVAGGDNRPETDQAKWDAIANGILSVDTGHLMTGHPQRGEEGRLFGSYITLNSIYRNLAEMASGSVDAYNGTPTLPALMFEGVYAGNGTPFSNPTLTAADTRPELWQTLLSGACGANHGNHEVWTCGWVNGVEEYPNWLDALDSDDHNAMIHIANFFDSIEWWTLLTSGPDDTSTYVTAGRSSAADYVAASFTSVLGVVAIPAGGQITIDMTEHSGTVAARFFDPTTGGFSTVSGSPFANTGTRNFDPPNNTAGATDMVLILEV